MFIGHFGAGMMAKKINRTPSLGTYFLAAQFIDLLWPILLLLGIEQVRIVPESSAFARLDFLYYPYSHGLLSVVIWSILFAIIYYFIRKDVKSSVLLGAVVLSHWILDLLTHRPDLPLVMGNGAKVGLGLWNSTILTIIIELGIFILGIILYLQSTKAKNKAAHFIFWGLIIFLLATYFISTFGPPPPTEKAIGFTGLSMWLLVAWGYWVDRNRNVKREM